MVLVIRKGIFIISLLCSVILSSYGQNYLIYKPFPVIDTCQKPLANAKDRLKIDLKELESKPKAQREYISSRYNARYNYYQDNVKDGSFLIGWEGENLINTLVNKILVSNPELDRNYHFWISRSTIPNAFSTGDGNFVINLGLLNKLNNSNELAFIICHEISHDFSRHSKRTVEAYAEKYMSKEFKKELQKTLNEQYEVKKKLELLVMPSFFNDMKFSRTNELEADSLGLKFYMKAGFPVKDAISAIETLQDIDEFYDKVPLKLKEKLAVQGVQFKDSWLYEHKSSLGDFEEEKFELEDSLRSHPDCAERKLALLRQINAADTLKTADQVYSQFDTLKLKSEMEMIHGYYLRGNLGRLMFHSFYLHMRHPELVYPASMLGYGFARLAYLQKMHRMGDEVSLPVGYYNANYKQFLAFLYELKTEDAISLGYYFLRPVKKEIEKEESYLAALAISSYMMGKKEEFENYKTNYVTLYPKGEHVTDLTNLNLNTK